MSAKCEVEVENQGDSQVEVKLFGEGKMVVRKRQALKAGELLVLAGDDKDNNAWFVILTLAKR
jgi:multidrug efflux pump subunit AcrA (membrane-fusion protein)